jgi:uncharacterized cupredoxin-like copper-binding protein
VPAIAFTAAIGLAASACGSTTTTTAPPTTATPGSPPTSAAPAPDPQLPTLQLTANESGDMFTYRGPTQATAGPVLLELSNTGQIDHQAGIAKLKPNVTPDQVEQAFKGPNPSVALALVDFSGGTNGVAPGKTGKTVVQLTPGDYEVYCFIPDMMGKPHVAHGMFQRLTVTAGGPAGTAPPVADAGTITMKDFSVILPDDFTGKGWYRVVNEGQQPHEAGAFQLAPGKTVDDFKTWQAAADAAAAGKGPGPTTPPPIMSAGGAAAASPGVDQWIQLDLDPSQHYVFVCFVPDVTKGFTPHWMEGMITPWPAR